MVDTAWYAPQLDMWATAIGELGGMLSRGVQPGEFTARLSDPDYPVTGLPGGGARAPDARPNVDSPPRLASTTGVLPGRYSAAQGA